jgi:hypothetical protein
VAAVPVAPEHFSSGAGLCRPALQAPAEIASAGEPNPGIIPNPLVPKPFSAQAVPILPMTSYKPNFWNTIATFCRELAPISGSLLDSISQTAAAIDRARYNSRSLRPGLVKDHKRLLPPEDDEHEP